MIFFRQTILNQIKSATNEEDVEGIIDDSIQRLKSKNVNGHIIQRYISGMQMSLHRERIMKHSATAIKNMDSAINVFNKMQRNVIT